MKYIDLSHTFTESMPVYPGDPEPRISHTAFLEKDGYNDFTIETGMHVGTHIDAPLHMIKDGKKIPELPVDNFFGRGRYINAVGCKEIGVELLSDDIQKGDILVINTGYYKKYRSSEYYGTYPEITEAFAEKLVEIGVKIVATDTPSPDRDPFKVHRILLSAEILIIENLTNLDELEKIDAFDICALPPKLDTEAAPVRVVAVVRE